MFTTTWGSTLIGRSEWALPYDLWGTLIATTRLAHGNIGGLYAPPTGLISLPGAAVILLPCAALITAFHLSLAIPGPANLHPAVWLLAGPYQIAIGCLPLFAADALAERLEVPRWTRGLLALAGAGVLWSVCARWGHPEDAVAVGLLLYAVLAQGNGRTARGRLAGRGGGLRPAAGAAGAADHARPAALAADAGRSWSAPPLPSAVLVAAAAIANWHDTYQSVTSQPDSPVINHPTIWTSLAPQIANHNVAAGPFRLATIVLACLCALAIRRRWAEHLGQPASQRALRWPNRAAGQRALVDRVHAGAAVVLRAGDGVLLPVAADGGRAHPGRHARLATPARGGPAGRPADRRRPGPVARLLDLVGPDRGRPHRAARHLLAAARPP